jgi:DNA invertase Pin-like site-specific DNA recombinase
MSQITAYSYVRWSSGKQRAGTSKERQIAETKAWIARQEGMVFADLGIDDGVSASTGKNVTKGSKLITFIEQAEKGIIKTPCILVVEQLDRITRLNVEDALALFLRLFKANVWVASTFLNQTFKGLKENDGKLFILIGSLLQGHEYSENLSKRSRASWDALHKKAKSGKIITPSIPFWLSINNGKFAIKEESQKYVNEIFKQYLKGFGADTIAKDLNQRQIPSPAQLSGRKLRKNKPRWTAKGITDLLINQNVIGNLVKTSIRGGKSKIQGYVNGYYPPVIDKQLFEKVQILRSKNKNSKGGRKGRWHHCLRNVLICADCGSTMRFYGQDPFFYVACNSAKIGTGCILPSKPIRYQLVLDAVVSVTAPVLIQYLYEKELPDNRRNLEAELSINEQQLDVANNNYRSATKNLESIPEVVFQTLNELEEENKRLKTLIRESNNIAEPDYDLTFLNDILNGDVLKKKNNPQNRQQFNNIINQFYESIELHQELRVVRVKSYNNHPDSGKQLVQYSMIDLVEDEMVRHITGIETEGGKKSFVKTRFQKLQWKEEVNVLHFKDILE